MWRQLSWVGQWNRMWVIVYLSITSHDHYMAICNSTYVLHHLPVHLICSICHCTQGIPISTHCLTVLVSLFLSMHDIDGCWWPASYTMKRLEFWFTVIQAMIDKLYILALFYIIYKGCHLSSSSLLPPCAHMTVLLMLDSVLIWSCNKWGAPNILFEH